MSDVMAANSDDVFATKVSFSRDPSDGRGLLLHRSINCATAVSSAN